MIYDILYDLFCIAFVLFNAVICWTWVKMRDALPWRGHRSVKIVVTAVVVGVGVWHLLFGLAKLAYLILWTVAT